MANRALVAGVDSSTQSTKVELRELESGQLVARASAPHTHTCWDPPVSEQDPQHLVGGAGGVLCPLRRSQTGPMWWQ